MLETNKTKNSLDSLLLVFGSPESFGKNSFLIPLLSANGVFGALCDFGSSLYFCGNGDNTALCCGHVVTMLDRLCRNFGSFLMFVIGVTEACDSLALFSRSRSDCCALWARIEAAAATATAAFACCCKLSLVVGLRLEASSSESDLL